MESMLSRNDEMTLLGGSYGIHSLERSFKESGANWLFRWQQSYISLLIYSAIIGAVAIYDISLTIKYAASLAQLEVNPIGRWLMNIEASEIYMLTTPSGMYFFLQLKALGTLVVIGIIHALVRWRLDMGHAVASGVSLFQIGLAAYLTFR